jgi:ATP/maltotriose-dependent transcriptional regulator MalT
MGPNHDGVDEWMPRLQADHDNLRAALDRLTTPETAEAAQQLAGALWKFWYMTGVMGEGARRIMPVLAYDTPRSAYRARALNGGTAMALETGDAVAGRRFAKEALAINRELGDEFGIAHAEFLLANAESGEGHWEAARPLLERSREVFRRLRPNGHYALLSTRILSWVYREIGENDLATQLSEQNLIDARAAGNRRIEAMTLGQLAYRAIDDGRLAEAAPLARDSLRMKRSLGDQIGVASDLFTNAGLLAGRGGATDSAQHLSRSLSLYAELGAAVPDYDRADIDALTAALRDALPDEALESATKAGRSMSDDEIDAILDDALAAAEG